jgi:hypothetical protein
MSVSLPVIVDARQDPLLKKSNMRIGTVLASVIHQPEGHKRQQVFDDYSAIPFLPVSSFQALFNTECFLVTSTSFPTSFTLLPSSLEFSAPSMEKLVSRPSFVFHTFTKIIR